MGNYPTAESIQADQKAPEEPRGAADAPPAETGKSGAGSNPMARVIEAVQTIAMLISVMEEKGDPKATQAKAALTQLMQALQGGGQGQGKPEGQSPALSAPEPMGMPGGGAKPMIPGHGGAPSGARIM